MKRSLYWISCCWQHKRQFLAVANLISKMALHASQENRNRKLVLEQLEEQKKRYRGGHSGTGGGNATPSTSSVSTSSSVMPIAGQPTVPVPSASAPISTISPDSAGMTSQQRTALQYAHANSFGYFIPQDSSVGNFILPVLPRYAEK